MIMCHLICWLCKIITVTQFGLRFNAGSNLFAACRLMRCLHANWWELQVNWIPVLEKTLLILQICIHHVLIRLAELWSQTLELCNQFKNSLGHWIMPSTYFPPFQNIAEQRDDHLAVASEILQGKSDMHTTAIIKQASSHECQGERITLTCTEICEAQWCFTQWRWHWPCCFQRGRWKSRLAHMLHLTHLVLLSLWYDWHACIVCMQCHSF